MNKNIHVYKIARDTRTIWNESPWIKAWGYLAGVFTFISLLSFLFPVPLKIKEFLLREDVIPWLAASTISSYFLLIAAMSGHSIYLEKKMRRIEQSFRYDNRGTLFNDDEPNIAFRIKTFKGILESLKKACDDGSIDSKIYDAGVEASEDFAKAFPALYDHIISGRIATPKWSALSLENKLARWAEYDSETGWGIVKCKITNEIIVKISHDNSLFEGDGGHVFAWFLAGYCETVISEILASEENKDYIKVGRAKFFSLNQDNETTITLSYQICQSA